MNNKYEVVKIETCKNRKYVFNDLEGWAKGICKLNNNECPCIMPPKDKEMATRYGCKGEYESHVHFNIHKVEG